MYKYILYSDGASRGNPGLSSSAAFLISNDEKLNIKVGICLQHATNNIAEYIGIHMGISLVNYLYNNPTDNICCYLDSKLVVKQVQNQWKIKNIKLKQIHLSIHNIIRPVQSIKFIHIERSKNKEADNIANIALDTNDKFIHIIANNNSNDVLYNKISDFVDNYINKYNYLWNVAI